MNYAYQIKVLLDSFWKWIGKSPEEYAERGLDYFYFYNTEKDFFNFKKLKKYAFEIIDKNVISKNILTELLTIMAIDNEEQCILSYVESNSSYIQIEKIIKISTLHLQPKAREQIVTLIYRKKPFNYFNYLSFFSNDLNITVKRRAQYALNFLSESIENKAEFKILTQFWEWIGITPQDYGENGISQKRGLFEDDFPFFEELIEYAKMIVDFRLLSENEVNNLFVIMALDNEAENILNYIEKHSSLEQVGKLISIGMKNMHYQGRWQLAKLIYQKKPLNYQRYLLFLAKDSNPVVSSCAKKYLCLSKK